MCELAAAHPTNVTANALGAIGQEARSAREARLGYPSLITLGHVRMMEVDVDGKTETYYSITSQGRRALAEGS